ncbi:SDR family NAD(P)-dependent oxidoreductase [Microvirga zambiensis]|uniref:SDR family NAD(P)-dependent oxidoreductase n=1 Tax=Microvirga zambiensis TaxID=1402137 RepID=UPI00191CD046|nr:SDR family oxidoreductase [Microvirga zambiensis]
MRNESAQNQSGTAFITGAAYGIGAAAALALARDGCDLVLADLSVEMLAETAAKVRELGRRAVPIRLDLRNQDSIESAVATALGSFERLDVLVNNAGVPLRKAALDVTRADWMQVMDVNLGGSFFMSQAVGRHWIENGQSGAIVSVASTHGLLGVPGSSTYGISKAGVAHMTRMLAIEWAPHKIRVNAIAPASTETPTRTGLSDPARREELLSRFPLRRFGKPEDMAEAIAYLASPRAEFITGQVLVLDGGLTVQ